MNLESTLPRGQAHDAMWRLGGPVSEEAMAPLGPILVGAAGAGPGDRVLDVAAGAGNVSVTTTRTGATVVFTEFSSREANTQALPFGDDSFDAVISAIGVMFAADHRSAVGELVRVCRPGGTIGVISWTLEGFFGELLAAISPYRLSGPTRIPMSALWGRKPYVRSLLGNGVRGVKMRRGALRLRRFDSAEAVLAYFKNHFGPMIEAFESIGDDPPLAAALDDQLIEIARDHMVHGALQWEYLLVTATKR
jgi:SAM-dependent methyltransferase